MSNESYPQDTRVAENNKAISRYARYSEHNGSKKQNQFLDFALVRGAARLNLTIPGE